MGDVDGGQTGADQRGEAIGGDGADDEGQWCGVPGTFPAHLEAAAQVSAAGANAEDVRRAAVLGFVDGVGAFVDQPGVTTSLGWRRAVGWRAGRRGH